MAALPKSFYYTEVGEPLGKSHPKVSTTSFLKDVSMKAIISRLGADTLMPSMYLLDDVTSKTFNLLFSIIFKGPPFFLTQAMSSTSISREGQDASTLFKTPTSETTHTSLSVVRSGQ